MKHHVFFARAVLATAAVGFLVAAPALAAGASTTTVSLGGLTAHVGTGPIVSIGTTPVDPGVLAGSPTGTAVPVPGADAKVPVHAHVHTNGSGLTGTMTPAGTSAPAVVPSDIRLDACVAASILTGHHIAGCPSILAGNPLLTGGLPAGVPSGVPGVGTGSLGLAGNPTALAASLADIGQCVQLAATGAEPVSTCTVPTIPSGTPLPSDLLSASGLCGVVDQLGLVTDGTCDPSSLLGAAGGTGNLDGAVGSTSLDGETNNPVTGPMCLGLAAVSGLDAGRCADPGAVVGHGHPKTGTRRPGSVTVKGATGAHASAAPSSASASASGEAGARGSAKSGSGTNGTCVLQSAHTSSTTPVNDMSVGALGAVGVALAAALSRRRRSAVTA